MGRRSPRTACALYIDEFLSVLSFEHDTLDTWCAAERTRLRELCYEALATLVSHCADTARLEEAIELSRRLVDRDPLREDAHRTLMRLFDRAGRRADALRQYTVCQEFLRAELSIGPEAVTTKLYHEIRSRKEAVPGETGTDAPAPALMSEMVTPPLMPDRVAANWKLAALAAGLAVAVVFLSAWVWSAINQQF